RAQLRRPASRLLLLAGTGLVLLTAFNYLRNANFYEENYRTANPLTMNLDESVAYLGAPFQGSVAAAQVAVGEAAHDLDVQLVPNPGAESSTHDWATYDGGLPPTPMLSRVANSPSVTSGRWALIARMPNPSAL